MILLHDPHADIGALLSERILSATRSILELVYKLCGTAYDLIYLDHACSFCWFVAGATLIRLLKVRMRAEDTVEAERITQEIGTVRCIEFRLLSYERFSNLQSYPAQVYVEQFRRTNYYWL